MSGSLVVAACGGSSVVTGGADGGGPGADGGALDAADGTVDVTARDAQVDQGGDETSDGMLDAPGVPDSPVEASSDASEGGPADSGQPDAGVPDATPDATSDAATDAGGDAGSLEAGADAEAGQDATPSDGAPADAAPEASMCTIAGTWSVTVQTVVAVPTFCQGVMDCTNCDILSNATATQPSATTIDWTVDPGGSICNTFTGTVSSGGSFATNETDCSPAGNGTTFNGQIDVATCSMTATYVYVLTGCTITYGITGTQ